MRISTEALPQHFEPAVNWIGGLIGAALDKRVAGFESQERANPLLASHFRENFALEFALAKARKYRKSTGRLPKGDEYDRLYSFHPHSSNSRRAASRREGPFRGQTARRRQ